MYRAMEPAERAKGIAQIAFQLDVLEGICAGPYLAGDVITSADSALFPTVVFLKQVRGRVSAGRSAAACDCAAAVVYDHAMRQLLRPPPHTHTRDHAHTDAARRVWLAGRVCRPPQARRLVGGAAAGPPRRAGEKN